MKRCIASLLTAIVMASVAGSARAQLAIRLQGSREVVIADKDIKALTIEAHEYDPADRAGAAELMTATVRMSGDAARRFQAFTAAHIRRTLEITAAGKTVIPVELASAIKDGVFVLALNDPAYPRILLDAFLKTRFPPSPGAKKKSAP